VFSFGISEADSKKGQIRCDVNVSIMDIDSDEADPKNWGTKVETKNVNSFSSVRDTIEYEIKRQIELKENGKYDEMEQQTRRFDEETRTTKYMRSKVDAIDYKYFIEPNIPKFKVTDKWLDEIKSEIPLLANERKERYINELGLKESDARVLVKEKSISDYFESVISSGVNAVEVANWMNTIVLGSINKLNVSIDEFFIKPDTLGKLIKMVEDGKLSKNQLKNVLYDAVDNERDPLEIIKTSDMEQIQDNDALNKLVKGVLDANSSQVDAYLNKGQTNIINFFLGQVMKETKGKANPAKTMELLKSELEKRR